MSDTLYILETILGIGLLIFFHEMGHFLAARWAGVRVDAFSLGFGPVLFSRQKGPTEYRLSLIPIGGYVKLAGELPNEARTGASDELSSKSVGTRAFIFSAGVLMNLLIAMILFPLLFWIGVPFVEPVIGTVAPGEAAWRAGVQPGSRIVEVQGKPVFGFEDLIHDYVLSGKDGIRVLLRNPDGMSQEAFIRPDPNRPNSQAIGVAPALNPRLAVEVEPDSPASRAGLKSGDRLLKLQGKELHVQDSILVQETFARAETLDLVVDRDGQTIPFRIAPEPASSGRKQVGVHPPYRTVHGIRGEELRLLGIAVGDILTEVNGTKLYEPGDLDRALKAGQVNRISILRNRKDGMDREESSPTQISKEFGIRDEAQKSQILSDLALSNDLETNEIVPVMGMPAQKAGVQPGDRIYQAGGQSVSRFRDLMVALQNSQSPEISLVVQRGFGNEAQILNLLLTPQPALSYGFQFSQNLYTYKSANPLAAVADGWRCSWGMVEELYLSIKKMISRELDAQNVLGGIIGIGGTAITISAQYGFIKFLFFLALLSINLAVLNILPIPILDGGHLFFLLIEKIKGSPVSERVLGYSQIVGLVLLLALMVFATYNDIQRFFS